MSGLVMSGGFVSIVGAGPGDPELLTLRAHDRLQRADLVLYDALSPPAVFSLAPRARRLFVGKRAGRKSIAQSTIHRLMIRAARRGERVVRLKGGDPFVLGRGGEEALALAAAGIAFEIVPGVSSAVAAAGSAGIPVTHRGIATGFVVVSGHTDEACREVLDSLAPHSATLVLLMGLSRRHDLAARLLRRGWSAATPTAVVLGATTAEGTVWRGTLATLGSCDPADLAPGAPGTIVVGQVVELSATIARQASRAPALAYAEPRARLAAAES